MFVLIGGGGRTGTQLAQLLMTYEHHVHVVESRPAILHRLHRDLPSEVIYEGHVNDVGVLEQAGSAQPMSSPPALRKTPTISPSATWPEPVTTSRASWRASMTPATPGSSTRNSMSTPPSTNPR